MKTRAKTALINGNVRPMDEACSTTEAVLLCGSTIEATGTTAEILALAGENPTVIDLAGDTLMPGFIDTHSHVSLYATLSEKVYCGIDAGTLDGVLARIKAYADTLEKGDWVIGWGFDDTGLPEMRGPSRQELDAISPDRPLLIYHMSYHASYANSRALEHFGYTAATRINGGEVVLGADGTPTGELLENAHFNAQAQLPRATPAQVRQGLLTAQSHYNAQGFTANHDGGLGLGDVPPDVFLSTAAALEQEDKLNLRLYLPYLPLLMNPLEDLGIPRGFGTPMIRFSGPKIFNDGAIQNYTAALRTPYHDRPDHKGSLLMPQEEMDTLVLRFHAAGYQIAYHGNGDAGIESFLTALEKAQRVAPRDDPRHILIHCQTASDEQLARMKSLGVLPTFFGMHVWYYGDRHYQRFLGPERAARVDPSGSAVRLGMRHSLHTDTPVMPVWSIRSIHSAVNRITRGGMLLGPEQRISAEEAVRAYTSHAAYFHFAEKERGSIEPGKQADLVRLSQDLLRVSPEHIEKTEVLMTMVGGRIVFTKEE